MTARKIPDIIKQAARDLRKNMTNSEKKLWEKLKTRKLLGKKFLRQYPIFIYTENSGLDRYLIPDFVCKEEKLIIEIDWSIHELNEIYNLDKAKEELLKNLWYKILRFKNEQIQNNLDEVLEKIAASFS